MSLALGYGIVWALVAGYVGWIGAQQCWLEERVNDLEKLLDAAKPEQEFPLRRAA